jgi:gliding motility-associated-like protein
VHPLPKSQYIVNKHVGCEPFLLNTVDKSLCKRDTIIDWQWSWGDGYTSYNQNGSHTYVHSGLYQPKLTVKSNAGCTHTWEDSIPIIVNEKPIADFEPSFYTISTLNLEAHFVNTSVSSNRWFWNFGDGNFSQSKNPNHTYTDTGNFNVMLVSYNPYNCADTIYKSIQVIPSHTFFLSNAFTPNTDDLNETWGPDGLFDGVRSYKLAVYNRWGEVVFTTSNIYERWNGLFDNNGKTCQQDVYFYRIEFVDFSYKKHVRNGEIHLLR